MTTVQATIEKPTDLIFAGKVNGTPVFNPNGERIGHIQDLAISKTTGEVAYAILSFGGLLGAGEKHVPTPWSVLSYDTRFDGYVVALDKDQLHQAPSYALEDLGDIGSAASHESLAQHWGPFI